jgi:hypothetical protein
MGGRLARVARHERSRRSGRTRVDVAGVPVRARPDTCSGADAALALWGGQGGVQLGPGAGEGGHGAAGAEASYGISEEDLTPNLSWSLYSLRREWNAAKAEVAPWWAECSKEAFNTGLDALAWSLKNWGDSRSGKRKGAPVGFPRFKSRHRASGSVRFTTGAIRCESKHAVLPRLGRIKLHEDASGLVERVSAGDARVISAAVRFARGRWFVSFTVDLDRPAKRPAHPDAVVGVDLGIKTLAVLSTGVHIPNPRHLSGALRKVAHLSRTAPAGSAHTTPRPSSVARPPTGGAKPPPRWARPRAGSQTSATTAPTS